MQEAFNIVKDPVTGEYPFYAAPEKLKFHLGDLLSVWFFAALSQMEKPPLREDGTSLPARTTPVSGLGDLAEYMTGMRFNQAGNQIDLDLLYVRQSALAEQLGTQFPFLKEIPRPSFKGAADKVAAVKEFVDGQTARIGAEYFEVEPFDAPRQARKPQPPAQQPVR